jgi:hypothetical protein
MRKPNYSQAKKQKEFARKARQQEKQQRRVVRTEPEGASSQAGAPEGSQLVDDQAADGPVGSGV